MYHYPFLEIQGHPTDHHKGMKSDCCHAGNDEGKDEEGGFNLVRSH